MQYFSADPRDAYSAGSSACNACCCGQASARPGETNKWDINYASWSQPLGGRGLIDRVSFDLQKKTNSVDTRAPVNTNKYFPAIFNTPLNGDVSVGASDPLEGTLTYALDGLNGPQFGEVVVDADGTFLYTPVLGFSGYDSFYVETTNEAKTVVNQVIVGVAASGAVDPLPAKAFDTAIAIVQKTVRVGQNQTLTFALKAAPLAVVGDVYRLTIKQPALDCDCQEYIHVSCYDITVVTC
jgi:hypothetical protein